MQAHNVEFAFLLQCLRRALSDSPSGLKLQLQTPPAIPEKLDWAALVTLAEKHTVVGLIYPQIASHAPQQFVNAWQRSWALAHILSTDLVLLLADFAAAAIDCMPLKGPVLAEALYGDIAARRSVDLDVMVRRSDLHAAQILLVQAGYSADPITTPGYDLPFSRDITRIELHSHLGRPDLCPLDADAIWSRSTPSTYQGHPLRLMAPEDLILYLCYHLLRHDCERLMWIADIARALQLLGQNDSGESLLRAARQMRLDAILLFVSALASATLLTPLPTAITAELLHQPKVERQAREFLDQMLNPLPDGSRPYVTWSFLEAEASFCCRWKKRLGGLVPTRSDRAWALSRRIPEPLVTPLLPLLRAARIVRTYGLGRSWRNFMQGTR
jgi:hypothetical protein